MTTKIAETVDRLEKLGFKTAAKKAKDNEQRARKMMLAYENFRFVRQEKVDAFNKALREKTINWDGLGGYQVLDFISAENYGGTPPEDVLGALEEAQKVGCFDSYEVAYIRKVNDPILFGRIQGCGDRFYIAQWDTDVRISDLIKDNEG